MFQLLVCVLLGWHGASAFKAGADNANKVEGRPAKFGSGDSFSEARDVVKVERAKDAEKERKRAWNSWVDAQKTKMHVMLQEASQLAVAPCWKRLRAWRGLGRPVMQRPLSR